MLINVGINRTKYSSDGTNQKSGHTKLSFLRRCDYVPWNIVATRLATKSRRCRRVCTVVWLQTQVKSVNTLKQLDDSPKEVEDSKWIHTGIRRAMGVKKRTCCGPDGIYTMGTIKPVDALPNVPRRSKLENMWPSQSTCEKAWELIFALKSNYSYNDRCKPLP